MAKDTKKTKTPEVADDQKVMPFGKQNFIIVLIGIVLIALGFILMIGGGSSDPNVFNPAMFSFRRLTLAPIVIIAGIVVVLFGIMKTPKEKKEE